MAARATSVVVKRYSARLRSVISGQVPHHECDKVVAFLQMLLPKFVAVGIPNPLFTAVCAAR